MSERSACKAKPYSASTLNLRNLIFRAQRVVAKPLSANAFKPFGSKNNTKNTIKRKAGKNHVILAGIGKIFCQCQVAFPQNSNPKTATEARPPIVRVQI